MHLISNIVTIFSGNPKSDEIYVDMSFMIRDRNFVLLKTDTLFLFYLLIIIINSVRSNSKLIVLLSLSKLILSLYLPVCILCPLLRSNLVITALLSEELSFYSSLLGCSVVSASSYIYG